MHCKWYKDKIHSALQSLSVSSIDDNVLTSRRNYGQKSKIVDDSEISTIAKKRNVGKGCHICGISFSKNNVKKRCKCNRFCHKSCVGHCNFVCE